MDAEQADRDHRQRQRVPDSADLAQHSDDEPEIARHFAPPRPRWLYPRSLTNPGLFRNDCTATFKQQPKSPANGADAQCIPSATLDAGGKPGAIFPLARVLL